MSDTLTATAQPNKSAGKSRLVESRRFGWVDLACALIAGAAWYLSDGRLGPWPLLIAAVPWVIRVIAGRFPVRRTRLDLLMLGFLVSAGVSAAIAYNSELAWGKFWLIVGAVVIFYAFAGQRSANIWPIMVGIGLFAVAVASYFLLTHDWIEAPAKIGFVNSIALQWMQFRPDLLSGAHQLHPNVAGGIMALLFPLALAGGIRATREWHKLAMLIIIGGALLVSASLILTTSRGAWLALAGGLAAWALWIGAGELHQRLYLSRRLTLGLLLLVIAGLGLTFVLLTPGGILGLLDRLPGPANAGSRLAISGEAIDLIGDFPIVGAGLGSFDGLYSQYIRVIPSHYLIHGHNLYLNLGVEQGLVGLAFVLAMIGSAFWWLADPDKSQPRRTLHGRSLLAGAIFATLVVMCIHGLVEDPLYGSRGVLLLWLPLGLTVSLFPRHPRRNTEDDGNRHTRLIVLGGLVALVILFSLLFWNPIVSYIESSRGALEMARIELVDYPTNRWSDGHEVSELSGAESRFQRAVLLNHDNRTAWHRMGLIAMLRRDYTLAAEQLANARQLDPNHRGIQKSLAYSLIWSGQSEQGISLLTDLPEAHDELSTYAWWWDTQNRPELGQQASDALQLLNSENTSP